MLKVSIVQATDLGEISLIQGGKNLQLQFTKTVTQFFKKNDNL